MHRREFLKRTGIVTATIAAAGCAGPGEEGADDGANDSGVGGDDGGVGGGEGGG